MRDASIWHALARTTSTKRPRCLLDAYRFSGFRPQATVNVVFGEPKALEVRQVGCRTCGKVKSEQLDFLADNPFYT
jgi:hypothetical protein